MEGHWTQRQRVVGRTPAPPGDLLGLKGLSCKRGHNTPFRMALNHREATQKKCTNMPGLYIELGKQATAVQKNPLSANCGQHLLDIPGRWEQRRQDLCHHSPPPGIAPIFWAQVLGNWNMVTTQRPSCG